ncbi:MAG: hypothetical protein MZW92_79565 [Comamonadaceae bacterium]|nr:hypothetical protein [Comamonadaceae bacterium]
MQVARDRLPARRRTRSSRRWPACIARCRGAYAVVAMIAGYGLLAFRDPYGIRPLVIGRNEQPRRHRVPGRLGERGARHAGLPGCCATSMPGEAVFIDMSGKLHSRQCAEQHGAHAPCIFEYVYLARPDSRDGRRLGLRDAASRWASTWPTRSSASMPHLEIDVVIPIPDSSRPSAMELAHPPGHALPRGLRQEPLHRPHLHHAGPGAAQEIGAPEAQRHRPGVQAARTCCWSTTPSCAAPPAARSCRWRATPARARCISPRPRRRCAFPTSTASTCRRAPS